MSREVERAEARLAEARRVFAGQAPEVRELWRVRVAERALEQARERLLDPARGNPTEAEAFVAEVKRLWPGAHLVLRRRGDT